MIQIEVDLNCRSLGICMLALQQGCLDRTSSRFILESETCSHPTDNHAQLPPHIRRVAASPPTIDQDGDVVCVLRSGSSQRVEKLSKTDEEPKEMAKGSIVQEGRLISESAAKTLRMMVWGRLFLSPMMHTWYNLMERVFIGTGKLVAAKKVVADMIIVAPQMPIWFFTTTGVMAGKPLKEAFDDAVEKQPMMLMANYMLWPAANSITYGVMPLQYRLLFANFVNVGWASVLSYMATHPVTTLPFLPTLKRAPAADSCDDNEKTPSSTKDSRTQQHQKLTNPDNVPRISFE